MVHCRFSAEQCLSGWMRLAGLGQKENALTLTGQGCLFAQLYTSAQLLCARSKEAGAAALQLYTGPVRRRTAAVCFLEPCFPSCGGLGYS